MHGWNSPTVLGIPWLSRSHGSFTTRPVNRSKALSYEEIERAFEYPLGRVPENALRGAVYELRVKPVCAEPFLPSTPESKTLHECSDPLAKLFVECRLHHVRPEAESSDLQFLIERRR
jgi:hypothetical protein